MSFAQKLFRTGRIYSVTTLTPIIIISGVVIVLSAFVVFTNFSNQILNGAFFLLALWVTILAARLSTVKSLLKSRTYLAQANDLDSSYDYSSTQDELDRSDNVQFIYQSDNSWLFDATFNFYTRTKYGTYLSTQAFYTVSEHKLSRMLPNLIFDSKSAKGKQYRYRYLSDQRLSLEGDFDTYFDTYAPGHYAVDTLSFITPEVMHQLIAAKDYDIEIIDDKLFLYGPLLYSNQLSDIQQHGKALATAINDNIDSYKDSYISDLQPDKTVTPYARVLLKSPFKLIVTSVITAIPSIALIVLAITQKDLRIVLNEVGILFIFICISSIFSVIKLNKDNAKQRASFLAIKRLKQDQRILTNIKH